MRLRHRVLVAAGLLAPACSPSGPAPAAHRASTGTTSPLHPLEPTDEATTTTEPPTTTTEAPVVKVAGLPPDTSGATTTTVRPRPLPTTTLPERADDDLSDAEWWASQEGFVPGACGGSLPPCYVMQRESGGNIHVYNRQGSGASGKWQFMPGTWAGYGGYANAADAPESVQDERARQVWAGGQGCAHWAAC